MNEDIAPIDSVSSEQNVARYVGGSNYDPTTKMVDGGAFDRKPKDTDGLSFTVRLWLDPEDGADKQKIRAIFNSRMKLGKNACFAELNVAEVMSALEQFGDNFAFAADPLPEEDGRLANAAHALLLGLPFKDESIGSLKSEYVGDLLKRVVVSTFPAVVIEEG